MISTDNQKNLFIEIGNKLPKSITVYAIGGTAMMFLGFKEATNDIDLVFTDKNDRRQFKEAAKSLGYKEEMDPVTVYGAKDNMPEMINLGDSRLDLFLLEVIDFVFSPNMQKRAGQIHQFGKNLVLKIADKHDIILMKCATKRIKDEDDIVNIIKSTDINWDILIEEAKVQVSLGKERAYFDMLELVTKLINKYKLKMSVPKNIWQCLADLVNKQVSLKK